MFFNSKIIYNEFVKDEDDLDRLIDVLYGAIDSDGKSNYKVMVIKQTPTKGGDCVTTQTDKPND